MVRPCNLACRWGEGSSVARASRGRGEISDAMGGTLEIPGQQARALGRLLGAFIDYLCGDTLESALSGLGGVGELDAGLGLSVEEGGDGGELGVVGVVDGLDPVLLPELVDGHGRARDRDPLRTRWLGGIHKVGPRERNEPRTVLGISSSFDRIIPTIMEVFPKTQLALSGI